MTIFQLECFLTLSQTMSFTRTAQMHFITQPALSRSISAMENELNATLVERKGHRISLTPSGEAFVEECKNLIGAYQRGVEKVKVITQGTAGTVRIGVAYDSYEPLAIQIIRALDTQHSDIYIDMKFSSAAGLIKLVDENLVDIVVASGKSKHRHVKSKLLEKRPLYAVMPSNHPLAERSEISLSELHNENFLAISHVTSYPGYESIIDMCTRSGFSPFIVREADTVSSLLMLVGSGMGVTILYKEHEPISNNQLSFVPLTEGYTFNRYLIWNDNNNPCLKAVIDVANELFGNKEI